MRPTPYGDETLNQPLTIVLPVNNSERQLRSSVRDILDITPLLTRQLNLVIVDDGSTDDTYETACELVRQYPQLTVLRQPFRQGLNAALELVRNRLSAEQVLVHDGVSMINIEQLQLALQNDRSSNAVEPAGSSTTSASESSGSRRFSTVRALHNRMEKVHAEANCFRWIRLEKPLVPRRRPTTIRQHDDPIGNKSIGLPLAGVHLPTGINPTSVT